MRFHIHKFWASIKIVYTAMSDGDKKHKASMPQSSSGTCLYRNPTLTKANAAATSAVADATERTNVYGNGSASEKACTTSSDEEEHAREE